MNDLQKKATVCLILVLMVAVFVPVYWLREPVRQQAAIARIHQEAVERGAEIFVSNCITCHGNTGDSLPGKNLNRTQLDEAALAKVISRGRPGTAMPAFGAEEGGALKKFEIANLITFIRDWEQPPVETALAHRAAGGLPVPGQVPPPAATPKGTPAPSTPPPAPRVTPPPEKPGPTLPPTTPPTTAGPDPQKGKTVYAAMGCNACHGADAQGGIGPALKGKSAADVERAVRNGGRGMPPFTTAQISNADLDNISAFLSTFAATPETPAAPSKPSPAPKATQPPQKPAATIPPTPLPTTGGPDPGKGKTVYSTMGCIACHGAEAQGGIGPALKGKSAADISRGVRTGGKGMPPFTAAQISDADLNNVVAFISSLK